MTPSPAGMNEEELKRVSHIAGLIAAYVKNTLDRKGHEELNEWINEDQNNLLLFEELTDERKIEETSRWMKEIDVQKALVEVKEKIKRKKTVRRGPGIWNYAASAGIIVVISLTVLKIYHTSRPVVSENVLSIEPGGNRAMLTFNDGSNMPLTDMRNGILKNENGTLIDKTKDGEIVYRLTSPHVVCEEAYNTLTTPRGGEYMLTLSDGSKVWLNAASSIKYPVAFDSGIRKVYITGEVYFEVKKDPSHPFVVGFNKNKQVTVLGTRFDIMSYGDEQGTRVTLEEGSVKVNDLFRLKPGEQYYGDYKDGKEQVLPDIDLNEELAWKKGNFYFNNISIQTIMTRLSRWYDIDVKYKGRITNLDFTAAIARTENINVLLSKLEKTGAIHFKIEGKTVIVSK